MPLLNINVKKNKSRVRMDFLKKLFGKDKKSPRNNTNDRTAANDFEGRLKQLNQANRELSKFFNLATYIKEERENFMMEFEKLIASNQFPDALIEGLVLSVINYGKQERLPIRAEDYLSMFLPDPAQLLLKIGPASIPAIHAEMIIYVGTKSVISGNSGTVRTLGDISGKYIYGFSLLCKLLGEFKSTYPLSISLLKKIVYLDIGIPSSMAEFFLPLQLSAIEAIGKIGDKNALDDLRTFKQLIDPGASNYAYQISDWIDRELSKQEFISNDSEEVREAIKQLYSVLDNSAAQTWLEKDNLGTRIKDYAHAKSIDLLNINTGIPVISYSFHSLDNCIKSMCDLDYIHIAKDTHQLICTEVLTFGVVKSPTGIFETIILGKGLSQRMFLSARTSFLKYGGERIAEVVSNEQNSDNISFSDNKSTEVVFVREYQDHKYGITGTYRIYRADSASAAKQFLTQNPVTRKYLYWIVETPEGNFGRDIDGIYQE